MNRPTSTRNRSTASIAVNQEGALLLALQSLDLQGQYAGDQVNIATAINTLETAKVNLFQSLNVPYKRDVEYERSIANLSISDYQQPSGQHLPYGPAAHTRH